MSDTDFINPKNGLYREPEKEVVSADTEALYRAIQNVPLEYRGELAELFPSIRKTDIRRRNLLQLIQDSLAQLRLDVKYLQFDLEATRKERDKALGY